MYSNNKSVSNTRHLKWTNTLVTELRTLKEMRGKGISKAVTRYWETIYQLKLFIYSINYSVISYKKHMLHWSMRKHSEFKNDWLIGLDDIPVMYMKPVSEFITSPIVHISNRSIDRNFHGQIPGVKDYWPISMLSVF